MHVSSLLRTASLVYLLPLTACISAPRVTAQERCAMNGLTLASSSNVNAGGVIGQTTGIFGASGYQCVRPATERERCEIQAHASAGAIKDDFGVTGRNVAIGVGYLLYIIPGIIMYFVFDSQKDDVEGEADSRRAAGLNRCVDQPPGPPGIATSPH